MNVLRLSGLHLVVPIVIITLALLALSSLIGRTSAFYRKQLAIEESATRFHSIDGLRGFLALAVMLHHAVITYYFYQSGKWVAPESKLANMLGQGGVGMFFLVTAFLFWSRALANKGRIDLDRFFWSRVTRLAPMFFVASGLVAVTALAFTAFRVEQPAEVLKQSLTWMSFGFLPGTMINGYPHTGVINTAFWSLAYEWCFYLAYPLLLLFCRGWWSYLLVGLASLLTAFYSTTGIQWFFVHGVLVAQLLFTFPTLSKLLKGWIGAVLASACLVAAVRLSATAYDPWTSALLAVPFMIVAAGNSMFGLLTCRPARILGMVSYSVYLMHGLALFLVFKLSDQFHLVAQLRLVPFWTLVAIVGAATLLTSALTYRFIEFPALGAQRTRN